MNCRIGHLLILLAAGAMGCANWVKTPPLATTPAEKERLQVWANDSLYLWRVVRVRGDSLSGIPVILNPQCRNCRVFIAVAEIDSVRKSKINPAGTAMLAVTGAAALAFFTLLFVLSNLPSD